MDAATTERPTLRYRQPRPRLLDDEMTATGLAEALEALTFRSDRTVVRMTRGARDFIARVLRRQPSP